MEPLTCLTRVPLQLIKDEPERAKQLLSMAQILRVKLKEQGFRLLGSSQIIPVILGDNLRAIEFAARLQERGYWVLAVRPPTVPAGEARLRLCLSYNHNVEDLNKLIDAFSEIRI